MNMVSIVSLLESHNTTCFREGPDGFLGFWGDVLLSLLLLLLLFLFPPPPPPVALEFPLLTLLDDDFFTFLLALDIQLASESVSDSRLIPKDDGLCEST